MPRTNLKVYLDHHIKRDNLLYKRTTQRAEDVRDPEQHLTIKDLIGPTSKIRRLRKPDFQRATWAWSPEECVELLESVLREQVVPSVIMWLSPDGFQYVLDGGHRISVLIAWVKNDWGDRLPSDQYKDRSLERDSKLAAQQVRTLLRQKNIGEFEEYEAADQRYEELREQDKEPEFEMDATSLDYAKVVRRWNAINMGFPSFGLKEVMRKLRSLS